MQDESLDQAIARFRSAIPNASGECSEKIDVVALLEPSFGDARVARFLLSVLRDPVEYDLARVEVCRALLGIGPEAVPWPGECAEALLAALQVSEDELVRQWAARALARVADLPNVQDALVERIVDPQEDLDVRHNALGALGTHRLSDESRAALAQRTGDPDIGTLIARYLGEA